jgi:hypothetical protein
MIDSKGIGIASVLIALALCQTAFPRTSAGCEKETKVTFSDGGSDNFGQSVAVNANAAVIGAPGDNAGLGAAYVYRWNGNEWTREQKLSASDGVAGDSFGFAVALSGGVAVVTAAGDDSGSGSAYVFRWNGVTWMQEQKLMASDRAAGDSFGWAASIYQDVVLIGANFDDARRGSAYVFRWNGTSWVQEQKLTSSDGVAGDFFGWAVSAGKDEVFVTANFDDSVRGAAYVFHFDGVSWVEDQKLTASDGGSNQDYGASVSLEGTVAVIGADSAGAGAAYVYRWNGASWVQEQRLVASDGVLNDLFGYSVSVHDGVVLVGAPEHHWPYEIGAAYVYRWNGATWSEEQQLLADDRAIGDFFGRTVSVGSSVAFVGASHDDAPENDRGSTYVYEWNGLSWLQDQQLTSTDASPGDLFGCSVAADGNRAVIGAYLDDSPLLDQGAADVYRRDDITWLAQQSLTASDASTDDGFGRSVSISGDVVLVGAYHGDFGRGSAYVYRWDGSSWVEEQKLLASDGAIGDLFGSSVSVSGDVALIGAYNDDSARGAAYVFRWDGAVWLEEQKLLAGNASAGDGFGSSVSVSGDVALVGAYNDDSGRGAAYVYRWNGASWAEEKKLLAGDGASGDLFGASVSLAGDTAVVGAPRDDAPEVDRGSAYVYRWNGVTWMQEQKLLASDGAAGDGFGFSVSVSGTVVLVGSYNDDAGRGSGYPYRWNGVTWVEEPKLLASDGVGGDQAGFSVAQTYGTAVLGAWKQDGARGAAYLFQFATWGNYGTGWPGTNGIPDFTLSDDPVLGSTITADIENSSGSTAQGVLIIGIRVANSNTLYGGTLLVVPGWVFPITIPGTGASLKTSIPGDCAFQGGLFYVQVLQTDPGASRGVSFTAGLEVKLGDS